VSVAMSRAVVIDDAFGGPVEGAISSTDKEQWIDFLSSDHQAEMLIRQALFDGNGGSLSDILERITGEYSLMLELWKLYKAGEIPGANLGLLFRDAANALEASLLKPNMIVAELVELCGPDGVKTFSDIASAANDLANADIAFIDFFLHDDEQVDQVRERLRQFAELIRKPKLLFFMSYRATQEHLSEARRILNKKSAFFEVLQKNNVTPELVARKIQDKLRFLPQNEALSSLVDQLIAATSNAVDEFKSQCDELEVHDLRLLNLARLKNENESLPDYLTWLFSEVIAAKTRNNVKAAVVGDIDATSVSFSGQIHHNKWPLFQFFSEIVFGPPLNADSNIRFGELIRSTSKNEYYLVLTPACDLARCSLEKNILCAVAAPKDFENYNSLISGRLYGKLSNTEIGHLLFSNIGGSNSRYTMLKWNYEITTFSLAQLKSAGFERMALMGELFAHEVKEEILSSLGRVGTQIDPSPPIAAKVKLQWKVNGTDIRRELAPQGDFIAALLSYAEDESDDERDRVVIFSDLFKSWAVSKIKESFAHTTIPTKIETYMNNIAEKNEFMLKNNSFKENDFTIQIVNADEDSSVRGVVILLIV